MHSLAIVTILPLPSAPDKRELSREGSKDPVATVLLIHLSRPVLHRRKSMPLYMRAWQGLGAAV